MVQWRLKGGIMRIAWAAGIIDGEGWIGLTKSQRGAISPSIKVVNTEKEILEELFSIFKVGSIRPRTKYERYRQAWVWSVYGGKAIAVLLQIQKYLISPNKRDKLLFVLKAVSFSYQDSQHSGCAYYS